MKIRRGEAGGRRRRRGPARRIKTASENLTSTSSDKNQGLPGDLRLEIFRTGLSGTVLAAPDGADRRRGRQPPGGIRDH